MFRLADHELKAARVSVQHLRIGDRVCWNPNPLYLDRIAGTGVICDVRLNNLGEIQAFIVDDDGVPGKLGQIRGSVDAADVRPL